MRDLSAADLLAGWEQGLGRSADEQALILLGAALPNATPGSLARLPIGQRDAALLAMRERVFGARMVGRAACPACGESLGMDFTVNDIRAQSHGAGATPNADHIEGTLADGPLFDDAAAIAFSHAGYQVRFRLPNTIDIRAVSHAGDLGDARAALIERCVLEARRDGGRVAAAELPEPIREAIAQRMADVDPQADLRLSLSCPACGHAWQTHFDIGAYFWEELHAWALRLLREVHILAHAYGWREADILALSPARRQVYLDMVQG
jgi:hypothetical protein